MKRFVFTAAIAAATATSALAADLGAQLYVKSPAPIYTWTGFYIGGNIGGGLAASRFDDPCFFCTSVSPSGGFFTGGGQAGYNYQFGGAVVGIEADVNGNSKFKSSVLGGNDNFAMTVGAAADVSGTIRGRAGAVIGANTLIYLTGGAAWAHVDQAGVGFVNFNLLPGSLGSPDGRTANGSGIVWGAVIGAGIEFAINPSWSFGAEFLHTSYQDRGANILESDGSSSCGPRPTTNCLVRHQLTTDVARFRINYRFGTP